MNIGGNEAVGWKRRFTLPNKEGERIPSTHTDEEGELGIILTPDFKFCAQSAHAASKANSILSMFKRAFVSRDTVLWSTLYRTYVSPHLEFAISGWNPFLKRDIDNLEKVQRRATRIPTSLRGVQYEERLDRLKLTTLKTRRLRGDLIQMFKIIKKTDVVMWHRNPTWTLPRYLRRSQIRREIVTSCQQRFNFFHNR